MDHDLSALLDGAGAHSYAVIRCVPVEPAAVAVYGDWLARGRHHPMTYMERYRDIRDNPALLLDGQAQSMIIALFAYHDSTAGDANGATDAAGDANGARVARGVHAPRIADYALAATDYHYALRARLLPVAEAVASRYGGDTQICVDSAPLRERYWAARAGLGVIARNNHLYVPGKGARFHITAIITTAILPGAVVPPSLYQQANGTAHHSPCPPGCRRCVDACPTHALVGDGSCDTSRCISCLTIEGCRLQPVPHPEIPRAGYIFGCDICRRVCPHTQSAAPVAVVDELLPDPRISALTADCWPDMGSAAFRRLFGHSPLYRAGLRGLRANLAILYNRTPPEIPLADS